MKTTSTKSGLILAVSLVAAFANLGLHARAGDGARLMMLVHHDDAEREWAYGPDSKIGTFSESLMEEAKDKGWTVISMKDDWKTIYPDSPIQ